MPTNVRRVQHPVYHTRRQQDGTERPATGFAEYTTEEGTYRGEWQDGQPHGTGTLFYNTGVRYSGSWRNGQPFGQGSWTREKPRVAPPKRARVAQCRCKVPRQLVERRLIEPISYSVFLKHEWPRGVNKSDRKAFARCVACWWPGGPADLGARIKETNPKAFAEFYKRVLSDKSGVEVLALNELPLGCRGAQSPKVMWEIWCRDPDRKDPESGRGTPMAVLYVRFREDYSQSHEARHSSVRCIHITFCCIQEDRIPEDLSHTGGVENCENLWVKVVEMEDKTCNFHCVEVQEHGWRWRVPWETVSHCSRVYSGAEKACWTIYESLSPLKTVGGVCQGCDHVCEEDLAFAAVRKVLQDSLEKLSGVETFDGSPDLRAPVVSKVNTLVEGLCLPIDLQEHAALASYENCALLFSFLHGPGALEKHGLALFCEHLESLHWSTQVIENATTITAKRAIQASVSSVSFTRSVNLFLFVGNVIRVREATYMLPDDANILASFRHNRVDWEEEVKSKAFSLDWFQEQLAAVRAYGAPPALIIVDSHDTIGDLSGHYIPTCQRRAHNSMVLRCYRDGGRQLSERENQAGSAFLAHLQRWIIQRAIDFHDTLMRLHSSFESEFSECELKLDYDGLRQNFMFHPSFRVAEANARRRYVPLPSYEVEPEDRMAVAQSFRSRLLWRVPPDVVAGRPEFVNRKVRIPSLGVGAQDCLDYLESRCLECKPQGSWMRGVCMLCGDHGIGKTTMAGALLHRLYWQNYCQAFFWLHGTNSTQLYYDCLTLAHFLGLVDDNEDALEAVLARIRQWMTLHPGWFVVLEDVEDEAVMDLLDLPLSHGMVLVISRPAHWKSVKWQNLVELPHLSNDEGQAYVLRTLKNESPSLVDSLLRELHNHPLSLSLALSLMKQEKMKLVKFMATKKPVDLTFEMRYCSAGMTSKERGYVCALMSVVASTMTALHKVDPVLQFMMLACACCHSNSIHRNIFEAMDHCDRHFDTLICYGCLEVSGDATLRMNPLLQLAIREHFPDLKEAGLDRFCALLEKGMSHHDKEKVQIRPERGEWLVHVLEAESLGGTFSFSFVRACAEYIAGNLHDLDEPLRLLRKLHEEASTKDGDYPRLLAVSFHTGELHVRREEYHDAQFQLEQFLKMFHDLDCQHDGWFVKATCLVADCFRAQGKHAEALNRFEQAMYACSQFPVVESDERKGEWFKFFLRLQVDLQSAVSDFEAMSRQFVLDFSCAAGLPTDSIQLAKIALNTMQSPFQELTPGCTMVEMQVKSDIQSLLPEGSKLYQGPLHFVQKLHEMCQMEEEDENPLSQGRMTSLIDRVSCAYLEGVEDQVKLHRADILSKIGDTLSDLGNHELAEFQYIEAMHIQNAVLENAAKKIARMQEGDAAGNQKEGKDVAENEAIQGSSILPGARDEDLTRVAATLLKIGLSRTLQRKFEKAIETVDECRAIRTHVFGHEHRAIAEVYELHGRVLHDQARYRQAVQVFDRAKRIYRTRLGPGSWDVARTSVGVGMAQDQLGQWDSAAAEYSGALKIYETCKDTLNAARCLNNLAVIHRKQGDYAKAQAFLVKAKSFVSNKMGENNLEFAGIVRNMGSVHFELEAWKEAQSEWELSLKIVRSCAPNESLDHAHNMLNLGSVHLKMSRYRSAHEMFGQAYAMLVRLSGPEHVDTARALVGLGTSNEKLGDLVQARSRLETALAVLRQSLGDSHLEVCAAEMNLGTVLLKEATAKTKSQDDGGFPMSSAFCLELKIKKDVLEDLQTNTKFQKSLEIEIAEVLGVQPAQMKMTSVLPERNAVVMRVYRGAVGDATPAELVTRIIEQSHDAASKLFQGTYGSKVKHVEGFQEASDSLHEALSMYKHVVQVRTAKFTSDDLDVANALRCIGNIHMISGDRNQAVAEYWKATRIFESRLGKDHDNTLSTHRSIEAALEEELLLATKAKEAKALALKQATIALAQTRSKAREAIKAACEDADQEAIAHLESATRRLEECKRWLDPNPFSYTPVRQRMKRTTRFKIKGNDFGPENRGKFGTVQDAVHDNSLILFKLDNGIEMQVSGIDFENNADYIMPNGLEVGRKLVITGLAKNKKYNGLHCRIQGVHKTDPHRCYVVSGENLELEVKFENCEFALQSSYRQGLRVKLQNLTGNNSNYNGNEATIVRAFEQDPSRILVRIDNGNRMCAVKSEHMGLILRKGYSVGCRVVTEGLQKQSQNGKFGTIERPDEEDIDRAIVWLEPVGDLVVGTFKSIRYENLRFALPRGLEKGRQVVYNSVKGKVMRADNLDSALIVVNFPEKDKTGEFVDKEQAVPLREVVLQLPSHLKEGMSVQLRDLQSKLYNDLHGFILSAAPQDPERVVVALESGARVQVRFQNIFLIS